MPLELNPRETKLLGLLSSIPPVWDGAAEFLRAEDMTTSEVTRVAIEYVHECFFEVIDFAHDKKSLPPADIVPNLHSTYICDVIKFLLQHGLNPNEIHEDENTMNCLKYVDNELLAADTLALLLEHGGNCDLIIPGEGEPLFDAMDFDVFFGAIEQLNRQLFSSLVHCWMVMIGYGAQCDEDNILVFKEYNSSKFFDLKKLRNHRDYYFGLMHLDDGFSINIYDKATLWEVARVRS